MAKDVKPFKHFLIELGARENATWREAAASYATEASDTPLPEPFLPQKLLEEWRADFDAKHSQVGLWSLCLGFGAHARLPRSWDVCRKPTPDVFGAWEELVTDEDFADLILECSDGDVLAHRAICCKACPKLASKLLRNSIARCTYHESLRPWSHSSET